jgi:uncharacterized protein
MAMHFFKRLLRACSIALLFLVGFLTCCQSKLIYLPRGYSQELLRNANARELSYKTQQGLQTAWIHPAKSEGRGLVWLVFGGNGTVALDWLDYFDKPPLSEDTFILFDYPGYGQCEGHPSPASIRESVQKLLPALAMELKTTEGELRPRLRVFGHSLGCAAGLIAMEEHAIQRAVLLAPFTTMKDMARIVLGWPWCEILHHRFDNIATLERLQKREGVRILMRHGTQDEVIPVEMGRTLGKKFSNFVEYADITGGRHNDILNTDRTEIHSAMIQIR